MKCATPTIRLTIACLCLAGCQSQPPPPAPEPVAAQAVAKPTPVAKPKQHKPPSPRVSRFRTAEQIQLLSDFAMKESPKIWQTVQTMRAEIAESGSKIKRLRDDLLEFDRNPDTDDDYKTLVAGLEGLKRAHDAIFDRLEDAYIAAKKYEASPSRKDYQETMKRALEDGIQDATIATERYKAMTRMK